MTEIWKGAPVAAAITQDLTARAALLREKGIAPALVILRIGAQEGALTYERAAMRRCETIGIEARTVSLPADCSQEAVLAEIDAINRDPSVHGCLLFRPLPRHLNERVICNALAPEKDVDCITDISLAGLFSGSAVGYPPCTAQACMEMLRHYGAELSGKRAVVIGRSLVIGKPVAMLLLAENATVTICHTRTPDPAALCREADIVVAAAGRAGIVDEHFVRSGQIVLDVGINASPDGGICGDVAFASVDGRVRALTPVPGGIGSVTTAVLCKHVITAAERAASR